MSDKLQGGVLAGSVDVSWGIVLRKTSDSTEQTAKVAADMTLSYWRQGGLRVAVAASDLAAVNSAHSDGGVKEVDATNMPGTYRVDWPDAAFATGADWVQIVVKVASVFVFNERIPLTTHVIQTGDSFARLGAPAGASIAADLVAISVLVVAVDNFVDTEVAAILAAIDTEIASIQAKTDLIPGTIDGQTFSTGWALMMSVLFGKASGLAGTTVVYRAVDDSKPRVTATVDASGNRTAVTLDGS